MLKNGEAWEKKEKKKTVLGVFEMPRHKILKCKLGISAGHQCFGPQYIFSILQQFRT